MPERLRIFISSPGDVAEERLRAHLVIQKLARDFARYFRIEAYLWEHEPMLASGHFQDAIEPPSACDVVVLIVYSRLGTELPERSGAREYRGIDGRAPVTGTEWEYEEALAAARERGAPDLLAYRKLGDPGASLADAGRRAEQERQWNALEGFWRRHFEDSGMFLAGASKFATLEDFDRKLEADLTALIERRIAAQKTAGAAAEAGAWFHGNPYQGLSSYEFEHAAIFFGRDAQIRSAVTRLQAAAEKGTSFLFVAGGSGSGKSSLARAGVAAALVAPKAVPGVGLWRRVVVRPGDGGDDPVLGLAKALLAGDPAKGEGLREIAGTGIDAQALAAHLKAAADDPSFPFRAALGRIAEEARKSGTMLAHEEARLLLLVDQLEELFAPRIGQAERESFARILAALARSGLVWIVATMRSDLWHRVAETRPLLELIEAGSRLDLQVPDGAEILEMVRRPALAAGLRFETNPETGIGLDAVIANVAAEDPGALPLLSVMLHALYLRDVAGAEGRGPAETLTFATYREFGELKGAIARRAEEVLAALRTADAEAAEALPVVLRSLVTVAADRSTVTARAARLDQFPEGGPEARLISAFLASDARLFVASASGGGAEVRVAHEALLSHWPRARDQIATDRRDLETRSRLEAMQHRWREAVARRERRQSLLTGVNLAEGRDLVRRWKLEASPLGSYVAQSQSAASFRRRAFAAGAGALVLIFACLALVAGYWGWRANEAAIVAEHSRREAEMQRMAAEQERFRAEEQRQLALTMRSEAERQAAAAEASRQAAMEAAARAEAEGERALAALAETKRETARTLASQTELSLVSNDIRGALSLAVEAADIEADVLRPGDPAASEPALLRAMAQVRQELRIERASQKRALPYAFLGDAAFVYADPEAGLVIVDLEPEPTIRLRVGLPQDLLPTRLAVSSAGNRVVLAGVRTLLVIEAETGRIRYQAELPAEITGIDVNEATGFAAVGFGASFALVAPDAEQRPLPIAIPLPRPNVNVGQVRFSARGDILYVTYGSDVLRYNVRSRSFAPEPVARLSAASIGGDAALLDEILQTGRVVVTELAPDLERDDRLVMMGSLELADIDLSTGAARAFDRSDPNFLYLGLSFTDQARQGWPQELIAVLARARNPGQDIRLDYVGDDGTQLPFESFGLAADDLAGEKPYSCQVSRNVSHLACHYWGDVREGLVVWRLLGGNHRFERRVARGDATSIAAAADSSAVFVTTRGGEILLVADGRDTVAAALGQGWTLGGFDGRHVSAFSAGFGEAKVWRLDPKGRLLTLVAEGPATMPPLIDAARGHALFVGVDGLAMRDLKTGATVWEGSEVAIDAVGAPDGRLIAALGPSAVSLFDAGNGEPRARYRLTRDDGSPYAFDGEARALAFVAKGALNVLDLRTGETRALGDFGADIAALAWAGGSLIVGRRDGGLVAIDPAGKTLWLVRSPLGEAFGEGTAWPGQAPKGFVHRIAVSPDGGRVAVMREDMPALDIHEAETGRLLTTLTPPWSFGVPASVSLPDATRIVTSWAVHPLARDQASAVSVHDLPATFEGVLAAARERLARLETIWLPSGAPVVTGTVAE